MLNLGILYKNDIVVNHRSLFKVLINPLMRRFGYCFGTTLYDNGKLGSYTLMKCQKQPLKWEFSNHNVFDRIEKKRRIF